MNGDHHPVGRPSGESGAELLPCPFCGGTFVAQGASRDQISVWCSCGAQGPAVPFPEINPEPIVAIRQCFAAWNRRAPDRALLDRIEELEGAVSDIAEATDPDNAESYRCDDREGCLDTVHAIARKALSGEKP